MIRKQTGNPEMETLTNPQYEDQNPTKKRGEKRQKIEKVKTKQKIITKRIKE